MKNTKVDLLKTHKQEYITPKKPQMVRVKPALYLAIDGQGEPGGQAFQEAIGALMSVAFTIKMARKFAGKDYAVCKLEGLWSNVCAPRAQWRWRLMIRTPDFINDKDMKMAATKLAAKGPLVSKVQLVELAEGDCVQMLHVGPYEKVGESVALMEAFATENKMRVSGECHEIYLSDPRRVAPAKLKTILRRSVMEARAK